MAISTKVGSFLTGTGTTAVSPTSFGFQPKVVCLATSQNGGAATAGDNHIRVLGCATDEATDQQRVVSANCEQSLDPSGCRSIVRNDAVLAVSEDGVLIGDLSFTSFDADGFTVTPVDAFTSDTTVFYFALGGADITNVALFTWTLPTGTGAFTICSSGCTQTVSTLNFAPDFFMTWGSKRSTINTEGADASFGIGFTDGTSAALYAELAADGNTTSGVNKYARSAAAQLELYATMGSGTAVDNRVSFVDFNANGGGTGLSLNMVEASGTAFLNVGLAIKGGEWCVGDWLTQTGTGTFTEVSTCTSTPKLIVNTHVSVSAAQSTENLGSASAAASIGAATSSSAMWSAYSGAGSGAAANDAYKNAHDTDSFSSRYNTTLGLIGEVAMTTMGTTFTFDQIDADAAQVFNIYFAVGDNAATGGVRRRQVIS